MDDTLHHLTKLSEVRAERDQLRAELERVRKRLETCQQALKGLLDDLARPGDPQFDLTTLVIDTQTRVPMEPRNG